MEKDALSKQNTGKLSFLLIFMKMNHKTKEKEHQSLIII